MPNSVRSVATRRTFLAHVVLGGAALILSLSSLAACAEAGPWFAWVSDIHIAADPKTVNSGQVTAENLRAVVVDILAQPDRPRGVVITGDLAMRDGQPGDYQTLRELLAPLWKERVPVHLVLGNHDNREHFRAALHVEPPAEKAVADKHVAVLSAGPNLRFVLLDSNQGNGAVGGRLGESQIAWLTQVLDADPTRPTILFLHHVPATEGTDLVDTKEFLDVVQPRRQVKAVVFGHSHTWSHTERDGLHFINLPATAYHFAAKQPIGWVRFQPTEQGGTLELRCIGEDRDRQGERVELKWRT